MSERNKRVVVTGINLITALGLDLATSWENLVAGKSGARKITLFDTAENATKIAAELPPEFDDYAAKHCKKYLSKQMARSTKMCFVCTKEAVRNSNIDFEKFDKSRCGVIFGLVGTGYSSQHILRDPKHLIIKTMTNAMSAWVSIEYKLEGPNYTVATACSSAAYAIANGYDLIQSDKCDLVIVGGGGSGVNPDEIRGFNDLFALSLRNDEPEKASRPFSIDRDGFVMGEGAGVLVLESEESARSRGAEIHAEMLGHALTTEAYNIMQPQKDGVGMARTMDLALKNSGVRKEEVDYINAHGTSTDLNDRYETLAVKRVFGELAYKIPVSAAKSMIGHTISAAGGVEAVITIMSLKKNIITPTINYNPDPELDLDYVPDKAREKELRTAISNSFAFGGHNACLVFGKYE
jgi:3-oxoacyl-[acyl-carrier-protein] synthase II